MKDKIFDTEFYKKLESISLNVKMLMNEGAAGGRKSKAKGSSVEFCDYREYARGDDFRRIDWNAYGRFDKLFIKLFMEEREALVNIFIDSSKSMDFGELKKSEMALKLAAVLTFLALNNLDRVCINDISGESLKISKIMMGKNMFSTCIEYLQNIEFKDNTNINKCIKKKVLNSRGVSIIVSDFFTEGSLEETIKYLAYKKQEIILIHLLSKEELNPELHGHIRLIDSETGEGRNIVVTSQLLKKYEDSVKEFQNGINEVARKVGAHYMLVDSSDSIEKVVFEKFIDTGIIR